MKTESLQIYRQRINAVIDYVNAHLDRAHSLDELSRIARFSKFHFHRVFKNVTGETVNEFVKRLRLERAVKLLRRVPRLSVTQVALHCGFESASDFSRSFKHRYGFSPREFSDKRFREESKICKELAASIHCPLRSQNTDMNPDGFAARIDEHAGCTLAYVRVFGAFDPNRTINGMNTLSNGQDLWGSIRNHAYSACRRMTWIQRQRTDFDSTGACEFQREQLAPVMCRLGDLKEVCMRLSYVKVTSNCSIARGSGCSEVGCRAADTSLETSPQWNGISLIQPSRAGKNTE